MGKALKSSNSQDEEITQYEKKLVQVRKYFLYLIFCRCLYKILF